MQHPLRVYTEVRVLIPARKQCGGLRRWVQVDSTITKVHDMNDGSYMYTVTTGDLVSQKNVIQVI